MLIDWFTVVAQTINFLILVWLMRRFLYQPVLKAIDAREKLIAEELADAAATQAKAEGEQESFQTKNKDFDEQRSQLLAKATEEATGERKRLLSEAREAADTMSTKRLESLHHDAQNLNKALTRRTQDEVFSIARQTLADLADTDLEKRATTVFIQKLRAMEGTPKSDFSKALKSSPDPAQVRSAFDLPSEQRAELQNAINETFSLDTQLHFETTPDLVTGIELTASGSKLSWTIADYLQSLKKRVGELLGEKSKVKAEPEPKGS